MTDREYVTRGCLLKGWDLIKPKKGNPGILVMDGGRVLVDAQKWSDARKQLDQANRNAMEAQS